jgi:hypothetical protein
MVTVMPSFDDHVRPSIGGYPDVEGYLSATSSQLPSENDNMIDFNEHIQSSKLPLAQDRRPPAMPLLQVGVIQLIRDQGLGWIEVGMTRKLSLVQMQLAFHLI